MNSENLSFTVNKLNKKIINLLSNLKFAIFVLLIIAGFSILGTIIEQNQSIEFYQENYPKSTQGLSFLNWENITLLNLDNVYRSWWYLSLLILLGISLVICSFTQQLPMVKGSKYWKFIKKKKQLLNLDLKIKINRSDFSKIINVLNKETYNIFQYKNFLFCYKGIIGRVAPIIVHISIIQIFLGAICGALFGYGGQEIIPKTEIFHLQNVLNAGKFSQSPVNTAIRVNNFWIDYSSNINSPIKQFYSDISLLDTKGNEIRRKTISVNNPMHYKNITLYQSDWDILGIRGHLESNKKTIQYQAKKIQTPGGKRWLVQTNINNTRRNLLLKDLNKDISLYDEKGEFLKKIKEREDFELKGEIFVIDEIIPATGIDIKSDPGIPFVYIGFLFLIISTLLSFISFSKIWVFKKEDEIYIGGISNRAKISFERYFLQQVSKVRS